MRFGGCFGTLYRDSSQVLSSRIRFALRFEPSRARRPAVARASSEGTVTTAPISSVFELRCRECGKPYGHQPLSICDECFSPLEVVFDLEYARTRFTRES